MGLNNSDAVLRYIPAAAANLVLLGFHPETMVIPGISRQLDRADSTLESPTLLRFPIQAPPQKTINLPVGVPEVLLEGEQASGPWLPWVAMHWGERRGRGVKEEKWIEQMIENSAPALSTNSRRNVAQRAYRHSVIAFKA